eukprot:9127329-Lingulodinium_polyedra.AAC.1
MTVANCPPPQRVWLLSTLHPKYTTPPRPTRCAGSIERPCRGSFHPFFEVGSRANELKVVDVDNKEKAELAVH